MVCFSNDPLFKSGPFLLNRGSTGSLQYKIIMKLEKFFKFMSDLGSYLSIRSQLIWFFAPPAGQKSSTRMDILL